MDELIPVDPRVTPARVASLAVAFIYVLLAFWVGGSPTAVKMGCFTVMPLSCIWFPDVLGTFMGWGLSSVPITKETPEVFVYYGGWVLLFLPVIQALIVVLLS